MKITILALGSRGDAEPLIALGLGLRKAGYEVCIATHAPFETAVRNSGLQFSLVEPNPIEVMQSPVGQAAMESSRNPVRAFQNFARMVNPCMLQIGAGSWAACQGTEAILCTGIGFIFGPHIAERLNVPVIATSLQPDNPTRAFPTPTSSAQRNFGSIFNLLTWFINDVMRWLFFRTCINQWRQEQLNLPSIPSRTIYPRQLRRQKRPLVYGFSPTVLPKPPDWGDHIEIAGYWFLDSPGEWQPPAALADFLAAGPAPVYVGFGSMSTRKQEETTDLVLRALVRTRQRGLLVTGWGGLGQTDLPDNIFSVESAPHDWLFPQMAAVVHHGGAGTTAAGLRAGIPSIIVPFWEDQPFWGRRVANLGVGPPPIPRQKLTVERLAAAITTAVTDKEIQKRAAAIGEHIRAEDGVARAVEAISRYLPVR